MCIRDRFIDTPFRRLAVVEDGRLLGQISRRDVLQTQKRFSSQVRHRVKVLANKISPPNGDEEAKNYSDSETSQISYFMDRKAKTVDEDTGLISVAQIFLDTPYRRLPVVNDQGKLVGQISRRDLLNAAKEWISIPKPREKSILYLSSLVERQDAPFG